MFPSRIHKSLYIKTRQYAQIVDLQADKNSMGFATALRLLCDHTKLESTVRYLGIKVDDALKMAEQTEI